MTPAKEAEREVCIRRARTQLDYAVNALGYANFNEGTGVAWATAHATIAIGYAALAGLEEVSAGGELERQGQAG